MKILFGVYETQNLNDLQEAIPRLPVDLDLIERAAYLVGYPTSHHVAMG